LPEDWDDRRLNELLFPAPPSGGSPSVRGPVDFGAIHHQLQSNKYVTLQLLWEEYRQSTRPISIEKDWLFGRTSDTSSGDSLKGGNAENCDSMGTQLKSGLTILHRNVAFASAKKRELFDFSLVPCSLVGLRSHRKINLFRGKGDG
jgi:hypothetical protein